jgi:hypothetical protein
MRETLLFDKEMGITHYDFTRLLTRALGHNNFKLESGKISVVDGARRMDITLSEESERRIALVTMPVTFVQFALAGYDDPAGEMARIDLHFQRGGG